MTFFFSVISDFEELRRIEESWDAFAINQSDNPYISFKFLKMSLESKLPNCTPLLMIGRVNHNVVGIAPLIMRERLGMRIATFALPGTSSLDFVVDEQFRRKFIDYVLNYLFKTLKCKVVDLTFPAESSNVGVFQELCQIKGIHFGTEPYIGRRILEVECKWEQFENLKGGNFRRRFRKMENKLNRAGSCQISCVEKKEDDGDAFDKILKIDRRSWKETWRSRKGEKEDRELAITWQGATHLSETIPSFKRTVWFLELDDYPIAFAIVLQHKLTATIAKTSYDSRYRGFYPGMYLINAILRNLLNSGSVGKVDFMTDMPFMEAWTDLCRDRVRVLAGKGVMPRITMSLYQNRQIRRILNAVTSELPMRTAPLFG